MRRRHVVDLYIPVGPGSGGNTVAAMFTVFGLVVGFAVLVMAAVVLAFPGTDYTSVEYTPVPATSTQVGGGQR
ncbi:hypothetical protein ACIA5E_18935 [Nocardia asteroides]|uniref:hypothetical protein n=1 Tax=Nocardia asteroides TaxID=1824 RepID=UPI0037AE85AE